MKKNDLLIDETFYLVTNVCDIVQRIDDICILQMMYLQINTDDVCIL